MGPLYDLGCIPVFAALYGNEDDNGTHNHNLCGGFNELFNVTKCLEYKLHATQEQHKVITTY